MSGDAPEADPDSRAPPLDVDVEAVRSFGHRMIDLIADELARPAARPIYPPPRSREEMEAALGGPVPETGTDPNELLEEIRRTLLPAAANFVHPRIMGWVASTPVPTAGMIEALVATLRLFPYSWTLTPGSTQVEMTVVRWLSEMVGFGRDAAGYLTTGGTWANLVGLSVARVRRAGWDVRSEGLAGHAELTAYVSAEAHMCFEQSARLLGIGSARLRRIPVDADHRLRCDVLEAEIRADLAAGRRPFCIVGTAGTTNTGAIDPLAALAEIAARHALWFHVDGSYGAFAAMLPETRHLFAGIERADSLALDPHKWLNAPLEAGCILVRRWSDLADTFAFTPAYLATGESETGHDHWHHGFELTRTDRALKVWLALRQHGAEAYRAMIRHHLELAARLAAVLDQDPDFEVVSRPTLSACCFRYVPDRLRGRAEEHGDYLDRLNQAIEWDLMRDGRALITGTRLGGRRVLRACFINHRSTWRGVEEMLALLREIARERHRTLSAAPG